MKVLNSRHPGRSAESRDPGPAHGPPGSRIGPAARPDDAEDNGARTSKAARHKNSGGNTMSGPKSTTTRRRLALFTGSSMAAASIAAAASFGVMLAPSQALAQCAPAAPAAGPGADILNCVSSTTAYTPGGIVHTSSGDLTVNLTGTAATNLGSGGVSLTAGSLGDDLRFTRTNGSISGNGNTAAALVDLQSQNGDISILLGGAPLGSATGGGVSGNAANVQYGLRAQSSGAGNIEVLLNGSSGVSTGTAAANAGIAGLYATSNGGDISILQDFNAAGSGSPGITGRQYGIRAITNGDGDITVGNIARGWGGASGVTGVTTGTSGIAAIDASIGAGLLRIDMDAMSVSNTNTAGGIAIRAAAGTGDIIIRKTGSQLVSAGSASTGASQNTDIFVLTLGGGTATITNESVAAASSADAGFGFTSSAAVARGLLRATGNGKIVFDNVSGVSGGTFLLSGFNGDFTLNNASGVNGWMTGGDNYFAAGENTLNNLAGGVMGFGRNRLSSTCPALGGCGLNTVELQTTSLHFDGTANVINNRGDIVIGDVGLSGGNPLGATLEIQGLDTFNHHGIVVLGAFVPQGTDPRRPAGLPTSTNVYSGMLSDGHIDDLFVMRDSHWVGYEGSRILLDANLSVRGATQTACVRNTAGLAQNAVHDRTEGSFAFSDCLDLSGSIVEGRTGIVITDVAGGDRGAYSPEGNVIIDVAGGTAAPDAFFVASGSAYYDPANGGVVDKGLFVYTIAYDGDSEQFKIYGVESAGTQQFALLGQAANELWRTATASWYERQVEMRDVGGGRPSGGAWLRGTTQRGERESMNTVTIGTVGLDFDNSHVQERAAVTGGRDWVFGDDHTYGTVGVMFGYARNQVSFDSYANTANFEGPHGGVYGGFTSGALYIDGAVNALSVNLDNDIPTFDLLPLGTVMSTDVRSLGAQVEAGWRMAYGAVQVTPLAGVSWARSSLATMNVPAADPLRLGGEIEFEDVVSLRTSLGARVELRDLMPGIVPTSISLTARAVQEHDGEAAVSIVNLGPTALVGDTLDGTFGEVSASLAVGTEGGGAVGYLNLGGTFADGYRSIGTSLGFRVVW